MMADYLRREMPIIGPGLPLVSVYIYAVAHLIQILGLIFASMYFSRVDSIADSRSPLQQYTGTRNALRDGEEDIMAGRCGLGYL